MKIIQLFEDDCKQLTKDAELAMEYLCKVLDKMDEIKENAQEYDEDENEEEDAPSLRMRMRNMKHYGTRMRNVQNRMQNRYSY